MNGRVLRGEIDFLMLSLKSHWFNTICKLYYLSLGPCLLVA